MITASTDRPHCFSKPLVGLLVVFSTLVDFVSCSAQQPEFSIPNVIRLSERIISGSDPNTSQAFREIAAAGVTTIVSVDGGAPNIACAQEHKLRYVHVPIGYDGIPAAACLALTRIVRESSGPIYIHCHHGKHRGPAAAAIACRVAGTADRQQALAILQKAGTSRDYPGLWRDVRDFELPDANVTLPELVAVAKSKPLAKRMSEVGREFAKLEVAGKDGWKDSTAARHALLIREIVREYIRSPSEMRDEEFNSMMQSTENNAMKLFRAMKARDLKGMMRHHKALQQDCTECHASFRN